VNIIGPKRLRTITSAYYRGADGIIVVFDVSSQESFNHVNDWIIEVNRYTPDDSCRLLIGNKSDKPDRMIDTDKAKVRAIDINMATFADWDFG
jgi:Ras-related protein Rab-1A